MQKSITLLALETATDVCSVAIWHEERISFLSTQSRPRAHAENLTPMIGQALRYCDLASKDVDAIAVSMGPGSYTGLRIGVSTAKGFAFAHDLPLIGVPSLYALAELANQHAAPATWLCIAFNARKDEVYLQLFQKDAEGALRPMDDVAALQREDISTYIARWPADRLLVAGEGGPRVAEALAADRHVDLLPADVVSPSAQPVAELGVRYFREGRREDLALFEPFYLKEFIPKKRTASIFDRLPF